jgi:hypothetical protein
VGVIGTLETPVLGFRATGPSWIRKLVRGLRTHIRSVGLGGRLMKSSQRRQLEAMERRRAETEKRKHISVPRPLIWIWAIVWPLIGFAFSALGNEIAARIAPSVVDEVSNKAGFGPIYLRDDWPGDYCQAGANSAAFPVPAPPIDTVLQRDPLPFAFDLGAYAYQFGLLRIFVSAQPTVSVVIESMNVVTFSHQNSPLAWAIGLEPQCGGGETDVRNYELNLDSTQPQLHLVAVNNEAKSEGAFTPFEASASDPTIVLVDVKNCTGSRNWGLKVGYSVAGHKYEAVVGTAENPLRISGGPLSDQTATYFRDGDVFKKIPAWKFPSGC